MRKRANTTRLCLWLLILDLILMFVLFFGYPLGLIAESFSSSRIFLAIILVFFTCFSLFISFIEKEYHVRIMGDLEERLTDSFKYIGKINLLVEEFKEVFVPQKNFPESKAAFKRLLKDYVERILAISRQKWGAIRIIDTQKLNTVAEYWTRDSDLKANFTNKEIVNGSERFYAVSTATGNLRFKAYCILPKEIKEKEKTAFVVSMIGQLELMATVSFQGDNYRIKKGSR